MAALPSIYINLEDDVSKVVERIKRQHASELVLVCPKKCQLFADSINLRLLKKQTDLLGKEVFILTMDEKGQLYAREAGFGLKFLPKGHARPGISDIKPSKPHGAPVHHQPKANPITTTLGSLKHAADLILKPSPQEAPVKAHNTSKPAMVTKKAGVHKPILPKVAVTESYFPPDLETVYEKKKQKNYLQKVITGLVALSLVVILLVVFVVLPKATVAVYPKTEPLTRDMEVSAGTKVTAPDPDRLLLPATKISETLEVSNKFQSQGKKEVGNKAAGTVQIYNFTKQPLNLKAGTTVLTVGNKNYLLVSDITGLKVTGYSDPKTKEVDPNTLAAPVQVVAEQGGESYNLPAGVRMEITNQ